MTQVAGHVLEALQHQVADQRLGAEVTADQGARQFLELPEVGAFLNLA
jgi:hypothetical protein